MNGRFVLIAGAGPRGQAFAATMESPSRAGPAGHRLPRRRRRTWPTGRRWPWLGRLADLEKVLGERVVDEVAICLPFSQWQYTDGIAHIAEEAGKIVRVPMDVLDHSFARGKVEDLDGTPVYSLVSGPGPRAGAGGQAARGHRRLAARPRAPGAALPRHRLGHPPRGRRAGALPPDPRGPPRAALPDRQVPLHGRSDAEARVAELAAANEIDGPRLQGHRRSAHHAHRPAPAPLEPRRAAAALERAARRHEPRGPAAAARQRGRRLRPVAPPPALHEARHHRPLAGARPAASPSSTAGCEDDLEYIDRWSLWLDFQIMLRTIPAALEGR